MGAIHELKERADWLNGQVQALQQTLKRWQTDLPASEKEHMNLGGRPETDTVGWTQPLDPDPKANEVDHRALEAADRRSIPRRRGNPVAVLITQCQVPSAPLEAWVVDRSPDGLCLVIDEAAEVGDLFRVRPQDNRSHFKWFSMEVRDCRREGNIWTWGCRFERQLSWSELHLFT